MPFMNLMTFLFSDINDVCELSYFLYKTFAIETFRALQSIAF